MNFEREGASRQQTIGFCHQLPAVRCAGRRERSVSSTIQKPSPQMFACDNWAFRPRVQVRLRFTNTPGTVTGSEVVMLRTRLSTNSGQVVYRARTFRIESPTARQL